MSLKTTNNHIHIPEFYRIIALTYTHTRASGTSFYFSSRVPRTDELQRLRDSDQRLKQQYADSKRREHILARRLALKEQELQDYAVCNTHTNNVE